MENVENVITPDMHKWTFLTDSYNLMEIFNNVKAPR